MILHTESEARKSGLDKGSTALNFHPVSSCTFMHYEEKSSPCLPPTSSRTTSTPDSLLRLFIALLLANPLVASLSKCVAFEGISAPLWDLRAICLNFPCGGPIYPGWGSCAGEELKPVEIFWPQKLGAKSCPYWRRLSIIFGWTRFHPRALLAFSITVRDQWAATKFSIGFKPEIGKKCMLVSVEEIHQPDIYFRTNKIISLLSPNPKLLKHFIGNKSIEKKDFFTQMWRAPQCSPGVVVVVACP